MGAFRDSWQKAKKAMEAEPKFGKDWVSKTLGTISGRTSTSSRRC